MKVHNTLVASVMASLCMAGTATAAPGLMAPEADTVEESFSEDTLGGLEVPGYTPVSESQTVSGICPANLRPIAVEISGPLDRGTIALADTPLELQEGDELTLQTRVDNPFAEPIATETEIRTIEVDRGMGFEPVSTEVRQIQTVPASYEGGEIRTVDVGYHPSSHATATSSAFDDPATKNVSHEPDRDVWMTRSGGELIVDAESAVEEGLPIDESGEAIVATPDWDDVTPVSYETTGWDGQPMEDRVYVEGDVTPVGYETTDHHLDDQAELEVRQDLEVVMADEDAWEDRHGIDRKTTGDVPVGTQLEPGYLDEESVALTFTADADRLHELRSSVRHMAKQHNLYYGDAQRIRHFDMLGDDEWEPVFPVSSARTVDVPGGIQLVVTPIDGDADDLMAGLNDLRTNLEQGACPTFRTI